MDDEELADRVRELGIPDPNEREVANSLGVDRLIVSSAATLVRDWRVAGALMERFGNGFEYALCVETWCITRFDGCGEGYTAAEHESLPRAIIETCVEALSRGDSNQ